MDINYDAITGKTNFAEIIKITTNSMKKTINAFQNKHFWGYSQMGYGRGGEEAGESRTNTKICRTYLAIMKRGTVIAYLTKIQRVYQSRETLLEFH